MESKICTFCGIMRSIEDFHKNKKNKDGRARQCKFCYKYKKAAKPLNKGHRNWAYKRGYTWDQMASFGWVWRVIPKFCYNKT